MADNSNGVVSAEANIQAEAQVQATAAAKVIRKAVDFSNVETVKPWTITDGVCMELGIKLNPFASAKVILDNAEGYRWRESSIKALKAVAAKKKEVEEAQKKKALANPSVSGKSAQRRVCLPCGQNRAKGIQK